MRRITLVLFIALLAAGIGRTLTVAPPQSAYAQPTKESAGRDGKRVVESRAKTGTEKEAYERAKGNPPVEPTFTAQGGFENSLDKARQSALHAAKDKFRDYLRSQDDPVDREPSTELVRRMLIPNQEQVQEEAIKSPTSSSPETMYRVTVGVKVQHEHLRAMRTRDRSSEALGVIGLAAVVLLATAGFFRLDAMTKGYVTSWLLVGAVAAGSALLGVWAYAWPW